MPIVNFRINKIEAEKTEVKKEVGSVDVNSNFTISSIKKGKDKRVGDYLEVKFKFNVVYKPNVGSMALEGSLWYYTKGLNKVIEEEGEKINLKSDIANEISTVVLQGSLVESIEIAKRLKLPIPLKLPRVDVKQEKMEFNKAS